MPVAKYEKKEDIPKGWESDYEEKDGAFHFKAPDDGSAALKAALDTERTKREAAEKLATKAAEELRKKETERKAGESGITDEKLKEIRAEVRKEIETELAPKLTKAEADAKENRSLKLDSAIKKLAGDNGFLATKLDDYWKLHGDEFDLTDDGKPMVKANPGMTPAKLIESHKKIRPEWVQGTKAEGGGAAGQTTGTGTATTPSVDAVMANPSAALAAARASGKVE